MDEFFKGWSKFWSPGGGGVFVPGLRKKGEACRVFGGGFGCREWTSHGYGIRQRPRYLKKKGAKTNR